MTSRKESILLVDDDPEIVWALGKYFTRAGFPVMTCGDGEEAIALLKDKDFDIVITDIQMPRLNGLELVEWLRTNRASTKVAVITAFGGPSMKNLSVKKGAILYLEKPVDPDLLAQALFSSEKETAFSGSIDNIDLLDYLQLMILIGRQVVLEVSTKDGSQGWIFIDNGEVKHARCGDLEGEEALYKCCCFEGGSFLNLPWNDPDKITIKKPGDFLLMEAARKRDEARTESEQTSDKHPK